MQADGSSDPIKTAIARLERQYEEDKQSALEKQRQEYEKHFQQLKNNYMSPSTPSLAAPYSTYDPLLFRSTSKMAPSTPTVMSRLEKWGARARRDVQEESGQTEARNHQDERVGARGEFLRRGNRKLHEIQRYPSDSSAKSQSQQKGT